MIEVTMHQVTHLGHTIDAGWTASFEEEAETCCSEEVFMLYADRDTLIKSFIPWAPVKATFSDIINWTIVKKLSTEIHHEITAEIDKEILAAIKLEMENRNENRVHSRK